MEDLSALAARLAASVGDARGCLIVSRDGLVIGAHPEDGESQLKPAWLRFAALGEPDRGFVQFDNEIWCFVRRGAYAAFLVTSVTVRPGLAIDRIEQALLTAEEARAKRDSLRVPQAPAAPSGKPRTPLHADPSRIDDPVVIPSEKISTPASPSEGAAQPEVASPAPARPSDAGPNALVAQPTPADPSKEAVSAEGSGDVSEDEEDAEIDRVLLAREFSRLLQEEERGADGWKATDLGPKDP